MRTIQVQDLGRIQEIARVLARNGFGGVFETIGLAEHLPAGSDEVQTAPYARRLRQVLVDLGPTYVKLGQVLSVRPDILPADLLVEFQTLQDRVEPLPLEEVRRVIERELGQPMDEVFLEFDESPLGSASIAQVHAARLMSGEEVAVKLQRPGIERKIQSDIHILYTLGQLVEGRMHLPGLYTPTAIIQEFEQAIYSELDFTTEARSLERFGRHFANDTAISCPRVFPRWSTRRLLVMERLRGRPLSKVMNQASEHRAEARRAAHQLMEATYKQVFEHGFFHADPHPGNLLLLDDGRLGYLDFGVTGTLSGAMQDTIISAFTALVFRDAESLTMTIYRAGATREKVDLKAFRTEVGQLMVKYHGASLDDLATPATLNEVVEVASRYHLDLPSEFAILARAITLLEGQIRALMPGSDIVEEVKPYAQRLMTSRFAPERLARDAARLMLQLQGHAEDLPTQMGQVLGDVEAGRISIETRDPDAARLREAIGLAVQRTSLALLASTVSLGGLMFMAAWSPTPFGIPLFGLSGIFMAGAGAGLFGALGVHVLFAHWLSLEPWRRRLLGLIRFMSWRRSR